MKFKHKNIFYNIEYFNNIIGICDLNYIGGNFMKIKNKLNLNFKNALFITHNDADGSGCEILSNLYLEKYLDKIKFKYIEAQDGDLELDKALNSKLYDLIIMVDCSFKCTNTFLDLTDFIDDGNQFFLIDHHKNALDFSNFDWAFVSIEENNIKNSGTELFYQFLLQNFQNSEMNNNETLKEFVELIRSYDTWDWFETKNQKAADLTMLFYFDKKEFINNIIENIKNKGQVINNNQTLILKTLNKVNSNYIDLCLKSIDFIEHNNNKIALIVANQLQGLIANEVFKIYPEISYIVFIVTPDKLSLRSTDNREDVFVIAKSLNGGGHRNASGCNVDFKNFLLNYLY